MNVKCKLFFLVVVVVIAVPICNWFFSDFSDGEKKVKNERQMSSSVVETPKKFKPIITIQASIHQHNQVSIDGLSNLPGNVKYIYRILDAENNVIAEEHRVTDQPGKIQSKIFFIDTGLKDGTYYGEAIVTSDQLQNIQNIIEKKEIKTKTLFVINKEESIRSEKEFLEKQKKMVAELKYTMCRLLDELIDFRTTPEFIYYGFGIGGPYNSWLKRVQRLWKEVGREPYLSYIPEELQIAPARIMQIGTGLVKTRGLMSRDLQQDLNELKILLDYDKYKGGEK